MLLFHVCKEIILIDKGPREVDKGPREVETSLQFVFVLVNVPTICSSVGATSYFHK
jgi:hypothetical protein